MNTMTMHVKPCGSFVCDEPRPTDCDDLRTLKVPAWLDGEQLEEIAHMAANGAPNDVIDSFIAHMQGG